MSTATASPRRSSSRLFTITALLSLTLFTTPTKAQTSYDAPIPVSGPTYARTSLKWYILAGQPSTVDGTLPIGQFYSLDLATPWSADAPAWKRLQPGPQQSIFPAVFTADQKTMVVFHIGGLYSVYKYTVATDSWATSSMKFPDSGVQGVGAVTDPSTGLVYMAAGYTDRNSMDIYNPATDSVSQSKLPDPATTFPSRWYYSNSWSQQRKSVLYFGGYNITNNAANNAVSEYIPSATTWNTMATSGTAPANRADHCMASNDDGTKIVVYGGRLANNVFSGEVFILNTVTGAWTQGAPGQPRLYAACTIAGDQLLIWGGATTGSVMADSPVMVYNMATNAWVPNYTPPVAYVAAASASATAAKPTGTGTGGDAAGRGSNTGAIVGGIVGAIAVIGAIIGFLIYRRRQQRNTHTHTPVKTHSDDKETGAAAFSLTSGSGGSNNNEEELKRMQSQLENQQQQLELQRQLLALQQQSTTATSQPAMVQYQDPSTPYGYQDPSTPYGYQPPLYYPTVPISPHTMQTVPDTSSSSYAYSTSIPVVSGGGHSEIYQVTAEPIFAPTPLVYMPSDYILPPNPVSSPAVPTTVGSSSGGAGEDASTPFVVGAPVKKSQVSSPQAYVGHAGSWSSDSPHPNNPHTILD
ncbi:hypothetical protein BGZ47_011096 [Haplosporangium gracile]|nr:hypothetical protein BGZ47_011096 [Haplosporangium gracile]